ncbi:dihydrofolate reductase family protein [Paraburkholderia xenovorans]|uniref:dihydrofolate reductase family protein n=1 Tax=Paraburkholderia xenovorans TaxID=36873 RepID=UPI0038BA8C91
MRKLTVSAFISLDGVIQAPGGPAEDPSGDFRLGGWIVPYADEAIGQNLQDLLSQPFELLLGRCTYDIFAAYWPRVPADSSSRTIADPFNREPKHVATHRSGTLDWQNSHALEGDLADATRALKLQDGANLLTFGSSDMVRQLLVAGLVDELWLVIYPIILGRGKRLFGDDALASAFTLVHSASTPGGVLITRYVRDGEVRTGTFEEVDRHSLQ